MLLTRLQEETEAAVKVLQPFCVYDGDRIKCSCTTVSPGKCHSTGGFCLCSNRFKGNPDIRHIRRHSNYVERTKKRGSYKENVLYLYLTLLRLFYFAYVPHPYKREEALSGDLRHNTAVLMFGVILCLNWG